jgi:hypothetical protein
MRWRSENSCPHRESNSDLLVVQPVARYWKIYEEGREEARNRNRNVVGRKQRLLFHRLV